MAGTRPRPADRKKKLRRAASSDRRPSRDGDASGGTCSMACVAGASGRSTAARISTRLPPNKRRSPHGCTNFERRMTASGPSSSRTRRITSRTARPLNHFRCMRELPRTVHRQSRGDRPGPGPGAAGASSSALGLICRLGHAPAAAGRGRLIAKLALGYPPLLVVGMVAALQLLEPLEHLAEARGHHEVAARPLDLLGLGVCLRGGGDGEALERLDVSGELPQLHAGGAEPRAVEDGPAAGRHLVADLAEVTVERLQSSSRRGQIARGAFLEAPDDGSKREVERHDRRYPFLAVTAVNSC